jgi:hypothetical protein
VIKQVIPERHCAACNDEMDEFRRRTISTHSQIALFDRWAGSLAPSKRRKGKLSLQIPSNQRAAGSGRSHELDAVLLQDWRWSIRSG